MNVDAACVGKGFSQIEENLRKTLKKDIAKYRYGDGDAPIYRVKSADIGAAWGYEDGYYYPVQLDLELLYKNESKNPPTSVEAFGVFIYSPKSCDLSKAVIGQRFFNVQP